MTQSYVTETQVSVLLPEIYAMHGGRDDAVMLQAALRGINLAQLIIAQLFCPHEILYKSSPILIAAGAAQMSTGNIDGVNYLSLLGAARYDETTGKEYELEVFSDYSRMFKVVPATSTYPRAVCDYGSAIRFFPYIDASAWYLTFRYRRKPNKVTSGSSLVAFQDYDEMIILLASTYCWLVFEEKENYDLFNGVVDKLNTIFSSPVPTGKLIELRSVLHGANI
jgi:hypothetical protein